MTNLYLGSTVNKFYSLGGRVIVNSTIHLVRTPQTSSTNIKRNLQRHLIRVIQANNNYVGNSVLVVEGPLNPIPDVSGKIKQNFFMFLTAEEFILASFLMAQD